MLVFASENGEARALPINRNVSSRIFRSTVKGGRTCVAPSLRELAQRARHSLPTTAEQFSNKIYCHLLLSAPFFYGYNSSLESRSLLVSHTIFLLLNFPDLINSLLNSNLTVTDYIYFLTDYLSLTTKSPKIGIICFTPNLCC